jgi:hypothetical protein
MEFLMNMANNNLNEDYLTSTQLTELIQDIENCALRLVDAAKKAKENSKARSEFLKEDLENEFQ